MKVINDLIINIIASFVDFYESSGLHAAASNLISFLDDWQSYSSIFNEYMSGVYFLFGKSLVVYMVSVFAVVFVVRLLFAVVMLIGQFVP